MVSGWGRPGEAAKRTIRRACRPKVEKRRDAGARAAIVHGQWVVDGDQTIATGRSLLDARVEMSSTPTGEHRDTGARYAKAIKILSITPGTSLRRHTDCRGRGCTRIIVDRHGGE